MPVVRVEKHNYTAEPCYQWDRNQVLEIYGLSLPSTPEVHFYNNTMDRAIVRQATMNSAGVITVSVPNGLLQKPYTITAHLCIYTGATFKTQYTVKLPVTPRTQPADYTLEDDDDVYSFNELSNKVEQAVAELKAAEARFNASVNDLSTLVGEKFIDASLSQTGKAADAKAVSDAIAGTKKGISENTALIEAKVPAWSIEEPLIALHSGPISVEAKQLTANNANNETTEQTDITMINDGEIYVQITPTIKVYDNNNAYAKKASVSVLKNGDTIAELTYNVGDTANYQTDPDWSGVTKYIPVTVKKGDVISLKAYVLQSSYTSSNNYAHILANLSAYLCANENTLHTYHNISTSINTPSDSDILNALLGEE